MIVSESGDQTWPGAQLEVPIDPNGGESRFGWVVLSRDRPRLARRLASAAESNTGVHRRHHQPWLALVTGSITLATTRIRPGDLITGRGCAPRRCFLEITSCPYVAPEYLYWFWGTIRERLRNRRPCGHYSFINAHAIYTPGIRPYMGMSLSDTIMITMVDTWHDNWYR